ncbi:hypothetical protein ZHAS_00007229 [Anopheles sinensis]|uniref:Uncharacterized protein n=1 Tax=Anopheles sinensis TaxID=74873 RepID=A0A084VPG2_ANOSI|nr:hypothetical protein ZHAS_00007229 [Anopheles sinensis]
MYRKRNTLFITTIIGRWYASPNLGPPFHHGGLRGNRPRIGERWLLQGFPKGGRPREYSKKKPHQPPSDVRASGEWMN